MYCECCARDIKDDAYYRVTKDDAILCLDCGALFPVLKERGKWGLSFDGVTIEGIRSKDDALDIAAAVWPDETKIVEVIE